MRSAASKGIVDQEYKAFIASQECAICSIRKARWPQKRDEQLSRTEVAHVGVRGLSQKCDDRDTIPLCGRHHRLGKDAHHRLGKRFFEHHGTDRDALIQFYQQKFDKEKVA